MWTLRVGDADFTLRWRLIKAGFAKRLPRTERRSAVARRAASAGGLWEHLIRDKRDYAAHLDYLDYNPVKHGDAARVCDWPYSSLGRRVEQGWYPALGRAAAMT